MPLFVIANLVVFQPWDWDNTKVFLYWFVGACILIAAMLSKAWRAAARRPGVVAVRGLLAGVTVSMLLSGVLLHVNQIRGNDRAMLYGREEIVVAEAIRNRTPADALIAVGTYPNNAVLGLSGRQVLMAYPGWLWSHGFDEATRADRESNLRALYVLGPNAAEIISAYGIDFVVIGPWEIQNFGADPQAWRQRYPVVIETANYLVFAVRP
jgi:hypothetical protein